MSGETVVNAGRCLGDRERSVAAKLWALASSPGGGAESEAAMSKLLSMSERYGVPLSGLVGAERVFRYAGEEERVLVCALLRHFLGGGSRSYREARVGGGEVSVFLTDAEAERFSSLWDFHRREYMSARERMLGDLVYAYARRQSLFDPDEGKGGAVSGGGGKEGENSVSVPEDACLRLRRIMGLESLLEVSAYGLALPEGSSGEAC